jgi:hypothetical protein
MTSTVLLKHGKAMGSLYTFPMRLFWRRWQPKLSKLSRHFFFDLVRELSDKPHILDPALYSMENFTKHRSFYIPEAPVQISTRRPRFLTEIFHVFLLSFKANARIGHDRFLPHLCHFVERYPVLWIENVTDKPRMNKWNIFLPSVNWLSAYWLLYLLKISGELWARTRGPFEYKANVIARREITIWPCYISSYLVCHLCLTSGGNVRVTEDTEPVIVAVTLWTCVREMLSSNLDRNTDYPGRGFSYFSSVPSGKFQDSISTRHDRFLPNLLQFISRQSFCSSTLYIV